jgi:hypothetical protein
MVVWKTSQSSSQTRLHVVVLKLTSYSLKTSKVSLIVENNGIFNPEGYF